MAAPIEREDGLVPAVNGSGIRVALHAGLCPQRRPRTWNREASVGVRRTAAEEEEANAHHLGGGCLGGLLRGRRGAWRRIPEDSMEDTRIKGSTATCNDPVLT